MDNTTEHELMEVDVIEELEFMEVDSFEVLGTCCWVCFKTFEYSHCTWCPSSHHICLLCLKTVIRDFMDTKETIHLICPIGTCREAIHIDLVTREVDTLTYELLVKKLFKRQRKANEELAECLYQKISCLGCNTAADIAKEAIHFKCKNCSKEYCSYCHKDWAGSNSHNECRLLNCSGTKCFQQLDVSPDNWENELNNSESKWVSVKLQEREESAIRSLFNQTSSDFIITHITRLENSKLWEKYVLKRKHMVEEIGVAKINERVLFHGTSDNNIPVICQEGFDMRVETKNGALFGKGTYFSTTSNYSQKYAGSSNKLIIARVPCGNSVKGNQSYKRPPRDISGRMYDSCVNDESVPSIYCLFDNSQCYPAYVIEYKKK